MSRFGHDMGKVTTVTRREGLSHLRAAITALAIFGYFAIFTVVIPSWLLRSVLTTVSRGVADLTVLVIWFIFLGGGLWALRRAQDRGWI